MSMMRAVAAMAATTSLLWATGCEDPGPCEPRWAVVTDIDETLTTQDGEYLQQFTDPTHDPAERPDAAELMHAYADLGYTIIYITARAANLDLPDGRSATEATLDWLEGHDFPFAPEDLYLAETTGIGSATVEYKAGVLADREADGWSFAYAYGNADTDIDAFREGGISDEVIFHVGRTAGEIDGVETIPIDEAFTQHMADHMASVIEPACR